jgi:hypothetical protein
MAWAGIRLHFSVSDICKRPEKRPDATQITMVTRVFELAAGYYMGVHGYTCVCPCERMLPW